MMTTVKLLINGFHHTHVLMLLMISVLAEIQQEEGAGQHLQKTILRLRQDQKGERSAPITVFQYRTSFISIMSLKIIKTTVIYYYSTVIFVLRVTVKLSNPCLFYSPLKALTQALSLIN